uniref:Reverse transcriptase domain-containing protein n=1 Tax=Tanacetum cinerariifolium TaxID=118510 RepID=A0A6L2JPC3_TANCI|nr:reverse transcriptase domain-containing protein [Tanacetum cinerariifolium]
MAAEGNSDLPVPDLRTMEELCQPSLNGRGGPIALISNQATNFGLKNDMIQQLRNEITNFRQCPDESLFKAWERYKLSIDRCPNHNMLPVTQIDTLYNGLSLRHRDTINAAAGRTFMKRHPEECYDLIENMTAHHNDWDTLAQRSNTITNPKEELKGITTRSGTVYQRPTIPTTSSSLPSVVKHETEVTKDMVPPTNNGSNKDVQPSLSLPDLSPTCMTLKLADRLISRPVGVAEDAFVKVGTFRFVADFVIIDFDADPRVPLIIGRYFLKTGRDFIDVFEGELTLRVGKEAITFNLDQSSTYSANYNDMTANQIDVIDMACEEYSQEVLGFFDVIASGNPTPYYDPIVSTTSPTLIPFEDSDFLLEEVDAFLALDDDPTSPKVDQSYFDSEGGILLFQAFLNDDLSLPPPKQRNYLPQARKELKICKAKTDKSSIDEPPELN